MPTKKSTEPTKTHGDYSVEFVCVNCGHKIEKGVQWGRPIWFAEKSQTCPHCGCGEMKGTAVHGKDKT